MCSCPQKAHRKADYQRSSIQKLNTKKAHTHTMSQQRQRRPQQQQQQAKRKRARDMSSVKYRKVRN